MKKLLTLLLILFTTNAFSQAKNISVPDSTQKIFRVELSCGQCKFHMEGKGCSLAVKIKGKTYFVDGANIDDFGDAHASDGFCEAIKKAEAQGKVENGKFVATYLKLIK